MTNSDPRHNRFLVICVVATLFASAFALSANHADPDLWGHVQFGRDVWTYGLPQSTTYSFTGVGYRWINHENLAEAALAAGASAVGAPGLIVLKCLAGVAVCGWILMTLLRRGSAWLVAAGITMLTALNLNFFWQVRPQLFSYLYFALLLALLDHCFAGWQGRWWLSFGSRPVDRPLPDYSSQRMRRLWLAPILFLLWANTHGAFAAGLAIYVAYLVLRAIEALSCWGAEAWGVVRRLALMAVVAGLATLINPYGPNLHFWLLESLGAPRPEITEWHPPELSLDWIPWWICAACFCFTMLRTKRSRDFTHCVILALTFWQSMSHQRHIPFFALPFALWMTPHFESALARWNLVGSSETNDTDRPLGRAATVGFSLVGAFAAAILTWNLAQRLTDMPVERDRFPVSAVQFIEDEHLNGRLVVTYNWAQYLIACFGDRGDSPRIQVAFDGRFRTCYPQDVVDMHFDLILGEITALRHRDQHSQPFAGRRVLEHGDPNLVLVSRRQPHSQIVMWSQSDEWTLLYQDSLAQIWGRRAVYDDPQSSAWLPPRRRRIDDAKQIGSVTWPALPIRRDAMATGQADSTQRKEST